MLFSLGVAMQLWRVVNERTVQVYTFFGKVYMVDTTMKQHDLRDQLVNSKEGAPMGVGIWYEHFVTSPDAYRFRNADLENSLAAHLATAVVKQLSNLQLDVLQEDRNDLSRKVQEEVSPTSKQWGARLARATSATWPFVITA
jgi:hypothetical protein